MKSDILKSSMIKAEGRQQLHRRRMSKTSGVFENGNVVTAPVMQDSIKCLKKQVDIEKNGDEQFKKEELLSSQNICTPNVGDNNVANESNEAEKLKELLLVHLDLIQQQQEIILSKDRQIQSLRTEKENLKCRLERMERRMSILRTRDVADAPGDLSSPSLSTPSSSKRENQAKGIKRKSSFEPQNLDKRFAAESPDRNSFTAENKKDRTPTKSHSKNAQLKAYRESVRERRSQNSSPCHKNGREGTYNGSQFDTPSNKTIKPVAVTGRKACTNYDILRTKDMYYVTGELEAPCEIPEKKEDDPDMVLVPTWRIHKVPTGYTMEGTENITDDIYIKRHQKPEHEEKRRKRWDMQRLREQQMYEKLQQGRTAGSATKKEEVDINDTGNSISFLPDLERVEYIEICDEVPVSAFGYPIPKLETSEFDLPWSDLDQREKEEKSRSTRKRR